MKYPVGIDLDGVVADFSGGWRDAYRISFPECPPVPVEKWDFLEDAHFGTWGHFWKWVRTSGVFGKLEPYPGAFNTLGRIVEAGVPIVFITGRPMWAEEETLTWLARYGWGETPIHFNGSKGEVHCSVYVDDAPMYLEHLVEARPDATIFRFVRPWNEPLKGTRDITGWDSNTARRIIMAARTYNLTNGGTA